MQYFHRTAVTPERVMAEADTVLGGHLQLTEQSDRSRTFHGHIGTITVRVRAEGGHYTLVTVETDQLTESEADKLAKRFLGRVHKLNEPSHQLRGAY